jgi:hypothetical protein
MLCQRNSAEISFQAAAAFALTAPKCRPENRDYISAIASAKPSGVGAITRFCSFDYSKPTESLPFYVFQF